MALILSISLYTAFPALAGTLGTSEQLKACGEALNDCQGLVDADDRLVDQLKVVNKQLQDTLVKENKPITSTIWPYILVFIGGAVAGKVLLK